MDKIYSIVLDDSHFFESHESAIGIVVFDGFAHAILGVRFGDDISDLLIDFFALLHELFYEAFLLLHDNVIKHAATYGINN